MPWAAVPAVQAVRIVAFYSPFDPKGIWTSADDNAVSAEVHVHVCIADGRYNVLVRLDIRLDVFTG